VTAQELIKLASENVEAWSKGDWSLLRAPFLSDVLYSEIGTQRVFRGVDELVGSYKSWKETAPDGIGRVTNALVSGDTVILEVIWSGTQTGPLVGPGGTIPATGKAWSVPACQVMVFKNGKIAEFRHYFDMLTMLQQLGISPKMAEAETTQRLATGI
jgi:steroid delta-isomerase-like uncharacterized protein